MSGLDYSRRDYAPHEPVELVYSTSKHEFSYRPRSELFKYVGIPKDGIKKFDLPKHNRSIRIVLNWVDIDGYGSMEHVDRVINLPKRVWLGRKLVALSGNTKYEELFVVRE